MSETTTTVADENTVGGLLEFLDTAIVKGWLNDSTAKSMKTAVIQILGIEPDYETLNVRTLDVDDFFDRFRTKKRNSYSDSSMKIYKARMVKAIKMHLARLDGADWKAVAPTPRPGAVRANGVKTRTAETGKPDVSNAGQDGEEKPTVLTTISTVPMVRYPFPLRDNVDVSLSLPRDLTQEEAGRLATFIASLARTERKAITSS